MNTPKRSFASQTADGMHIAKFTAGKFLVVIALGVLLYVAHEAFIPIALALLPMIVRGCSSAVVDREAHQYDTGSSRDIRLQSWSPRRTSEICDSWMFHVEHCQRINASGVDACPCVSYPIPGCAQ